MPPLVGCSNVQIYNFHAPNVQNLDSMQILQNIVNRETILRAFKQLLWPSALLLLSLAGPGPRPGEAEGAVNGVADAFIYNIRRPLLARGHQATERMVLSNMSYNLSKLSVCHLTTFLSLLSL